MDSTLSVVISQGIFVRLDKAAICDYSVPTFTATFVGGGYHIIPDAPTSVRKVHSSNHSWSQVRQKSETNRACPVGAMVSDLGEVRAKWGWSVENRRFLRLKGGKWVRREVKKAVAMWMTVVMILTSMNSFGLPEVHAEDEEDARPVVVLTEPPGGLWTQCPDVLTVEGALEADVDLRQEQIDHYLQLVAQLPAYLSVSNAERVSAGLMEAENAYLALSETEQREPEVVAARASWLDLVMQSQNSALTAGGVTVNYVSPSALGEIENLVPRQGSAGPESEGASLDRANCTSANGTITSNVIHDQGTGGNQEMYSLARDGAVLDPAARLTVRYVNIGTYYEGRIYTDQNVPGVKVNAIVTISNPYNANRISLYENFWMGGTVNGGSGRLGYSTGTPGRADLSITFCDENWNVIRLKEDAQLIASSVSHGYYKGCSYEGISFSEGAADTTVRIYSREYGNIGIDSGEVFGLGETFYGQRSWKDYCAGVGGPHSDGQYYADTRQSTTFMVHGVAFYQNADTWNMTMTTQTTYSGGHDYWFYFTAAPANMARPAAPVKTVSKHEVKTGETVEYTLEQKLSTVQEDGYGYYGSLVFYDPLPPEVEYRSAVMYLDGVDVTEKAGVLSYNATERKVTYTFSASYLKNMNYSGQSAKLVIDCQLKEAVSGSDLIVNKGYVSVCGKVEAATAAFTPQYTVEADRVIRITKRIRAADTVFDHGIPVFLIRLDGQDILGEGRICYGAAVFSEETVNSGKEGDGYVSVEVVFDGLLPGVYTVSEEATNRYEVETVIGGANAVVVNEEIFFDLTKEQTGSAVIVNRKYEQGGFSHSCLVENVFSKN